MLVIRKHLSSQIRFSLVRILKVGIFTDSILYNYAKHFPYTTSPHSLNVLRKFSLNKLINVMLNDNLAAVLSVIELTKDHHPDRDDERARIEVAGGSVIVRGVPRVNGILAMSRSIGDIYLKR